MKFIAKVSAGLILLAASLSAGAVDMVKAKQNYDRFCASCHGFNGMSVIPDAPNLRMNQGLLQSDFQIVQKLKFGSPKKPPMVGMMTEQDLLDVIHYARVLR